MRRPRHYAVFTAIVVSSQQKVYAAFTETSPENLEEYGEQRDLLLSRISPTVWFPSRHDIVMVDLRYYKVHDPFLPRQQY